MSLRKLKTDKRKPTSANIFNKLLAENLSKRLNSLQPKETAFDQLKQSKNLCNVVLRNNSSYSPCLDETSIFDLNSEKSSEDDHFDQILGKRQHDQVPDSTSNSKYRHNCNGGDNIENYVSPKIATRDTSFRTSTPLHVHNTRETYDDERNIKKSYEIIENWSSDSRSFNELSGSKKCYKWDCSINQVPVKKLFDYGKRDKEEYSHNTMSSFVSSEESDLIPPNERNRKTNIITKSVKKIDAKSNKKLNHIGKQRSNKKDDKSWKNCFVLLDRKIVEDHIRKSKVPKRITEDAKSPIQNQEELVNEISARKMKTRSSRKQSVQNKTDEKLWKKCTVQLDRQIVDKYLKQNMNGAKLPKRSLRGIVDDAKLLKCCSVQLNKQSIDDYQKKMAKNGTIRDDLRNSIVHSYTENDISKKLNSYNFATGKGFQRSYSIFKTIKNSFCATGNNSTFASSKRQSLVRVLPQPDCDQSHFKLTGLESQLHEDPLISLNDDFRTEGHLTAREILLRTCNQRDLLKFETCYPDDEIQHCQKIGEGVYGEVFMKREADKSLTVMKIIPIEGNHLVNLEKQKTFSEVINEVIVTQELSSLRTNKQNNTDAFVELKRVRCVQGRYPDRLIELWDLYNENKGSENDSPEIFDQEQLYVVLELTNGGADLESYEFQGAHQGLSVFKQVCCALAVAESQLDFEHRDLHWGNILIKETDEKSSIFVIDGKEVYIENYGIKITIIDFTLSRIEQQNCVLFTDLTNEIELFEAEGDLQFEIYRLMKKNNSNNWQNFEPFSNILWLDYILDKGIKGLRYKHKTRRPHKEAIVTMKNLRKKILSYKSAFDFVLNNF